MSSAPGPRSDSPSSPSRTHARASELTKAQQGRKVVGKAVARVQEALQRVVKTCRALSWAFINNPRIVLQWYADIKDATIHFTKWVITGFRLFGADVSACRHLIKRVAMGYPLSIRERNLLVRTTSDCLKLIPFSLFIIVPFAELALPFFLRLFPNMLPSTFFEQKYDNATLARKFQAKQEMAEFWQQVVKQRTLEISESDSAKYADKRQELERFQEKLMAGVEYPSLKEILRFSQLFKEELSLKGMTQQQLRTMSRMLGLPTQSWWPGHLELQLRHHITNLRREDRDLKWEGIDGLSGSELIDHCKRRAIRFHEVTEDQMRKDLTRWVELSANHKAIHTSLLLWIQSFYLKDTIIEAEALQVRVEPQQEEPEAKPSEAFHAMSERQKAQLDEANKRLEAKRHELEEVLQEVHSKECRDEPLEKTHSLDDEESNPENVDAEHGKNVLIQQIQERDKTLKLYKDLVAKQKALLEQQLKFLVSMGNNKPTKHRDADVILLDQRVRLMEMMGSFNVKMEEIEQLLGEDVDTSDGRRIRFDLQGSEGDTLSTDPDVKLQAAKEPEKA